MRGTAALPQHAGSLVLLLTPPSTSFNINIKICNSQIRKLRSDHRQQQYYHYGRGVVAAAGKPEKAAWQMSDVVWPSAGAFAVMALLGKFDRIILAPKGIIPMSIAPLGAVSAVLFTTPSSPAARKYNIFMAQIGCSAIGVLAYSLFGPGWLARSAALSASIAFMILTRSIHPPAASLPILFIDGNVKLHNLSFWYAFFPGAAGCILLCFMQEIVSYLKENFKF